MSPNERSWIAERDLDPNLPIWELRKSWIGGNLSEIDLLSPSWVCGIAWPHGLLATTGNTQDAGNIVAWYQMGHLALQLLTQTSGGRRKNSQLSSVSVCASNDLRKCDLLSQAGVWGDTWVGFHFATLKWAQILEWHWNFTMTHTNSKK